MSLENLEYKQIKKYLFIFQKKAKDRMYFDSTTFSLSSEPQRTKKEKETQREKNTIDCLFLMS